MLKRKIFITLLLAIGFGVTGSSLSISQKLNTKLDRNGGNPEDVKTLSNVEKSLDTLFNGYTIKLDRNGGNPEDVKTLSNVEKSFDNLFNGYTIKLDRNGGNPEDVKTL